MEKKTLKIEGMSCEHCVARVKKGLGNLGGVNVLDVNLEKGEATVTYDEDQVNLTSIKKAVSEAGYEVK